MRILSPQNAILLCAALSIAQVDAHNMTACMCKRPQFLGAMEINRFGSCTLPDLKGSSQEVKYSLFSLRPQRDLFAGYACRFWKNVVKVDSYWTGSLDTVYYTEKIAATPQQCWDVINVHLCHGHGMTKDGSVWRYEARPTPDWRYRDTIIRESYNCIVEPVSLERATNSSAIRSVYGEVSYDAKAEAAVHHGVTFVWNKQPLAQTLPCKYHQLYSSVASIFNASGTERLRDPKYQVDFVIGSQVSACSNTFYTVVGDHELAVQYDRIPPTLEPLRPKDQHRLDSLTAKYRDHVMVGTYLDVLGHHTQYVEDTFSIQLNKLGREVGFLDCLIETARVERVQVLSQFSGVLAAEALGFQDCHSLKSFGRTGLLYKCEPTQVTFTTFQDRCGPQPVYRNFTIAKDGRTLVPLTPCAWKDGIVNFGGTVHQYRDNNWVPVTPSIVAKSAQLQTSFNFTTDQFDRYSSLFPAEDSSNLFQLFGELDGLLTDGSFSTITEFTDSRKETATASIFTTILHYVKWGCITVSTIVIVGLVAYVVFKYTNLLSMCCTGYQLLVSAIRRFFATKPTAPQGTPETTVIYQNPETVRLPVGKVYPSLDRRLPQNMELRQFSDLHHQDQETSTSQ